MLRPASIRQPCARQAILCPSDWPGQVETTSNQFLSCEGPTERSEKKLGTAAAAQPSSRRRQAQALARVERRRQEPQDYWQNSFRSVAHERGWDDW